MISAMHAAMVADYHPDPEARARAGALFRRSLERNGISDGRAEWLRDRLSEIEGEARVSHERRRAIKAARDADIKRRQEWAEHVKRVRAKYDRKEQERQDMIARATSILANAGIALTIDGCGCCGSPSVRMTAHGVDVVSDEGKPLDDFTINMHEADNEM